jgi:hypothetical protein
MSFGEGELEDPNQAGIEIAGVTGLDFETVRGTIY